MAGRRHALRSEMASSSMHPSALTLPPYSQPFGYASTESSPPPSPTQTENRPSDAPTARKQRSLQQFALRTPTDSSAQLSPRPLGRQETPPSPPNSVVLIDEDTRANTSAPVDRVASSKSAATSAAEGIPRTSLRGKFTKVFKGHRRGSSDAGSASPLVYQKHRKEYSSSTNATTSPLGQTGTTPSSHSSMQPSSSQDKTNFYSDKSPIVSGRTDVPYHGAKRKIMRGGEVRVEIQRDSNAAGQVKPNEAREDGSSMYYNYYTRSSMSQSEEGEDESAGFHRSQFSPKYITPLEEVGEQPQPGIERNMSNSSSESQERKYAEEATSSFGFEGFHFGLSESEKNTSDNGSLVQANSESPTSAPPTRGSGVSQPVGEIYSLSSGKASSSILNAPAGRGESATPSRSYSSLAYQLGSSRTPSSMAQRPGANRNLSSSSHVASGRSPSSEEVTRELKRLSKISAGSGMSGLAIVVGVDEATPLDGPADSDFGTRPTKEEKGKGRATPLGSDSMHDDGNGQNSDGRDHSSDYGRPKSGYYTGTESRTHSDEDDDSRGLLGGISDEDGGKKLKSQVPPKGVLVHQADTRFDFVYRMRQTADETPILVPQYSFPSTSSFPNRNALTPPAPAKLGSAGQDVPIPMPSSSSFQDSGVQRPSNAVLHPSRSEYESMPQGDYAYDTRKGSFSGEQVSPISPSYSMNDLDSQVHPALRENSKEGRSRDVVSMGSLEVFGGGFRTISGSARNTGIGPAANSEIVENFPPSDRPTKQVQIDDEIRRFSNTLREPSEASEEDMRQQLSAFNLSTLPRRPGLQRRSITPHLWAPSEIGDSSADLYKSDVEIQGGDEEQMALRRRQAKVGRMLFAFCLLFPPLLFVMGFNGFDTFVSGWTGGAVKRLGRTEKRLALAVGAVIAVGAVVGLAVGVAIGTAAA